MAFQKRSVAISTTPLPKGAMLQDEQTKTDGTLRDDRVNPLSMKDEHSSLPGDSEEEEEIEEVEETDSPSE